MTVLFVTGTDTGVGKTVTTAALAVNLRERGGTPYVVKPAQTGMSAGEPSDLDEIRRLAGILPGHVGVRLGEALAPATAARLEGAHLPDLLAQRDRILRAAERHQVLVEGAGGILVQLGAGWDLLDLAEAVAEFDQEVGFVVVARAGLGTLNHTSLTVRAIQQRDLAVHGLIIGIWESEPDLAAQQNLVDLPRLTGVPVLGRIPEGAGLLDKEEFRAAALACVSLP